MKVDNYIELVYPYSGVDPDNYYAFVNNIRQCKQEMFVRPQISKQYFYIAMSHLHEIEVQEPDMSPIISEIGTDFERLLIYEHTRRGINMFPRYLKT
jgi:hypothetical protein